MILLLRAGFGDERDGKIGQLSYGSEALSK
jgi:hypothetical protein